MSKGKGAIVKVSGLARRNQRRSSQNSRNRLNGQRGLPSRTRTVTDYSHDGYNVTYEV